MVANVLTRIVGRTSEKVSENCPSSRSFTCIVNWLAEYQVEEKYAAPVKAINASVVSNKCNQNVWGFVKIYKQHNRCYHFCAAVQRAAINIIHELKVHLVDFACMWNTNSWWYKTDVFSGFVWILFRGCARNGSREVWPWSDTSLQLLLILWGMLLFIENVIFRKVFSI